MAPSITCVQKNILLNLSLWKLLENRLTSAFVNIKCFQINVFSLKYKIKKTGMVSPSLLRNMLMCMNILLLACSLSPSFPFWFFSYISSPLFRQGNVGIDKRPRILFPSS